MPGASPIFEEILLMVSNFRTSRAFYVDKLKLQAEYEGRDFAILRTGGSRILLHDAEGEPIRMTDLELEFRVDDVDALYTALSKQGVPFRRAPFDVSHEGDRWSPRREARLRDPDGYGITVFSPTKKR